MPGTGVFNVVHKKLQAATMQCIRGAANGNDWARRALLVLVKRNSSSDERMLLPGCYIIGVVVRSGRQCPQRFGAKVSERTEIVQLNFGTHVHWGRTGVQRRRINTARKVDRTGRYALLLANRHASDPQARSREALVGRCNLLCRCLAKALGVDPNSSKVTGLGAAEAEAGAEAEARARAKAKVEAKVEARQSVFLP